MPTLFRECFAFRNPFADRTSSTFNVVLCTVEQCRQFSDLETQARSAMHVFRSERVDLLVFPEAMFESAHDITRFDASAQRDFVERSGRLAASLAVQLCVTLPYPLDDEGVSFSNSSFVFSANGNIVARHNKTYLTDGERGVFEQEAEQQPTKLHLDGLDVKVAIGICYDLFSFTFTKRTIADADIGLLLLPVYCGAGELEKSEARPAAEEAADAYARQLICADCDAPRRRPVTLLVADQPFGAVGRSQDYALGATCALQIAKTDLLRSALPRKVGSSFMLARLSRTSGELLSSAVKRG